MPVTLWQLWNQGRFSELCGEMGSGFNLGSIVSFFVQTPDYLTI